MSGRSAYELWDRLGDDERGFFLNALYPGLAPVAQHDRLQRDWRTGAHPEVVLAMSAVLRRRESAFLRIRPVASPPSPPSPPTIEMPPPQPRLQDLCGGMLDPLRMAANTAVLREHQTQVEVWAATVKKVCRAKAEVIAVAIAEREAAARMAMAEAAMAEGEFRQQQIDTSNRLLNDTLKERRDLARAITNIYSNPKGEPK